MAYREGQDGAVKLGNVAFDIQSWTMNQAPGVADVSPIGSSGPKRIYTGYVDYTGTLTAAYQSTAPFATVEDQFEKAASPAASVLKLIEGSASMWVGNVVFTNLSKTQDAPGVQQWSGDWATSNGRFAHNTSTSS